MATYRQGGSTVKITSIPAAGGDPRRGTPQRAVRWVVCLVLGTAAASGCSNASDDRLQGRWIGHPQTPSADAGGRGTATGTTLQGVEFQLDFLDASRFVMTLVDANGRLDRQEGRYRVDRVYGPRWDVVMITDEPVREVTLELVFDGDRQMTVKEVQGDSRLPKFVFQRLEVTPGNDGLESEKTEG